jgi:hypothetical protein
LIQVKKELGLRMAAMKFAAALVGCGHLSGLFVRRLSRWP